MKMVCGALFLQECRNAAQSLEAINVLVFSEYFRKLVSKLSFYLHDRWRSIVQRTKDSGSIVRFDQLVEFVTIEAKKVNGPISANDTLAPEHKDPVIAQRPRTGKGSFASNVHKDDSQMNLNKSSDSSQMLASSSNRPHGECLNNSVATEIYTE